MKTLLTLGVWCLLFVLCWPLALLALLLWPIVWLVSLPLRLVGITLKAAARAAGYRPRACGPPFPARGALQDARAHGHAALRHHEEAALAQLDRTMRLSPGFPWGRRLAPGRPRLYYQPTGRSNMF